MIDRTSDDDIPDHRVPDILARAAELDRNRTETSSIEALRAVAQDAGISLSSLEAARSHRLAGSGADTAKQIEGETRGQAARRPCPHCAELILPDAKICRFCRTDLTETGESS